MKTKTITSAIVLAIALAVSFAGFSFAADIDTGLVGHWKLDEGSGTIAADSSGNNHNGTIVGGPVWKNDIDSPQALEFDGKDDAVELGDIDEFEFGPDDRFTISLWLKPTSDVLSSLIIGRGDRSPWNPEKWTWNLTKEDSFKSFRFGVGDGTKYAWQSFYTPLLDRWYHVTIVSGKLDENIDYYINGVLQQEKSIKRTVGQLRQTDGSFRIGGDKDYPYYFFKGQIGDVRIYNRALNQDEINTVLLSIGLKPPLVKGQDLTTTTNTPKSITLIAEDVNQDLLTYSIVTPPVNGALTGTLPNVTYTPNTDFTGNDSFTFKANDGSFDSNVATVSITVVIPSFPGAEGFGAMATGGRGGNVLHVTTLNDNGDDRNPLPGSLRWAILQKYPRIIVFDVGGVIEPKTPLSIGSGDVTIAGQTATGGLVITGNKLASGSNNLIIRHMRVRGTQNSPLASESSDAMNMSGRNFILDHISLTAGSDEIMDVWYPTSGDYTIQWCSIEESPLWGQGGANHQKGDHNLGWVQGNSPTAKFTMHHTLIANQKFRLPEVNMITNGGVDFRNNILYNWAEWANNFLSAGHFNVINNCYIPGPSALSEYNKGYLIEANGGYFYPRNFPGNLWFKSAGVEPVDLSTLSTWGYRPTYNFINEPWPAPPVKTESAIDAYNSVLDKVGAWPRDATTRRTVNEVRTRTGGMGLRGPYEYFPEKSGPTSAEYDTDRDGMPDAWESAHNLDPNNPGDGNNIVPSSVSERYKGYTYIEYYINEVADDITGQLGSVYKIQTNVYPNDAGAVIPSHGNYSWETERIGGYNVPYWYGKIDFGTAEFNEGSIVIMKAKPKPGYVFDHWQGGPVDGLTSTQVKFPAYSNSTITAVFRPLSKYNITINISPENSGNVAGKGEYNEGETVTLAAYSNNNYKFKRWVGGSLDNTTNPIIQLSANSDVVLTAEFEQGSGGDVLIDDFNDQDGNSFLIDSLGNPKKWDLRYEIFKEINPGNFALTSISKWYPGGLRLSSAAASDIPTGTTVIKLKLYNVGTKDAAITDKRIPYQDNDVANQFMFSFSESGKNWSTSFLFYAPPFRFPIIKPGESAIVAIPISLIKDKNLNYQMKSVSKLFYMNFTFNFLSEILWGSQVAGDDVAFGRASADPITAPNLSPIANAGYDQITRDVDMDGKETVLLNGLKSFDQDAGLIKTWVWSEAGQQIATGFAPSVDLATGTHDITLAITDEQGASSTDTVTIQVLAQESVPGPYTLTVSTTGAGSGTVTKSSEQELYTHGTTVILNAIPDSGSVFTSWSGDITGKQNPITITMLSNKNITATFDTKPALEGDVNDDAKVDIKDLIIVAKAFGLTPESPGWNASADLNNDNIINVKDIIIVARNFGKTGA